MRHVLEGYGWTVRGLEGAGDWLALKDGKVLHVEVKRQEVLRLPLWTRQALAECPRGARPVVAFRANRQPWQAVTPEPLLPARLETVGVPLLLNAEWWRCLRLDDLCAIIA